MTKELAGRITVIVMGILIILGIVMISKVFYRGMLVGVALAGCAVTLLWMSRALKGKR